MADLERPIEPDDDANHQDPGDQAVPELGEVGRAFADSFDFSLDDYQLQSIAHIEAGSGVLVAAPTGAGKTVAGEFAVALGLQQGRKVFYTTPIKALSNQKFHDLVDRFGVERVGLLTGDTSINSEAQVVVMTTEVLRNMIYARSATLRNLGFVVMDEVHYLADRFRGAVWEEVIIGLADSVQLVALSATVSNAEEFGEWLTEVRGDVRLVVSERRPVPLYQHVMVGRTLHDLFADEAPTAMPVPGGHSEVNPELVSIAKQESRVVRDDSRRPRGRSGRGKGGRGGGRTSAYGGGAHADHRMKLPKRFQTPRRSDVVGALSRDNLLPAIVFIFSRAGCDAAVRQLMQDGIRLTTSRERTRILSIIDRHIVGLADDDLAALGYQQFRSALASGIAAHHAGMLPAWKECVEECFVEGLIKVVYATETLALGINMPARSVVLEKLVKFNGEGHVDITPGEYTQLTGRAGRRGIDTEGHAVVLWQPGFDPRAVAGLASRRTYPLRSSFAPTYNMAVNLIGAVGRDRTRTLLEQSFAQFQSDRSVVGLARKVSRNDAEIAELWAKAECELGDFGSYAELREEISQLETEAARSRRADRRAEAEVSLQRLRPGDIVWVPAGKHTGWAVVIDSGPGDQRRGPRPLVLGEDRQVRRLGADDFPTPVEAVSRVRVPKRFSPRDAQSRRSLGAAMSARLAELDGDVERFRPGAMDAEVAQRISDLREQLAHHPCHACPERETQARWAERALRLSAEDRRIRRKMETRTNTIAVRFDRICQVLSAFGYLDEHDRVSAEGRMLARIYNELDLVAAETLRTGVLDELGPAQLAAVLSILVYEARRSDDRRPVWRLEDPAAEDAIEQVQRLHRQVSLAERDARLERGPDVDAGFAAATFAWASGIDLAEVLGITGMTAGDFVRCTRQVIDLTEQIGNAAGSIGKDEVRSTARSAVGALRRGVVDLTAEVEQAEVEQADTERAE
ncbi:DEAD/DEAH box helicase [Naumannella halotolerans]|uniref:ATP-dependent RNA helicase HelY n=1 Tax=Naumannella halotolerans TaxID=993414 RepID=A0A4V3ENC4_9ACTN|nr:DEAD/DEAH box helicase [Naumannella halotolerans]TDT33128.1 ATP-dependent RNA helicase HelY [Naumannella halotolerans]